MHAPQSKELVGTVVKALSPKTIHVAVPFQQIHQKTRKMITYDKHFLVHDANKEYKLGNLVQIEKSETPVTSKKHYVVVKKLREIAPNYSVRLSKPWDQVPKAQVEQVLNKFKNVENETDAKTQSILNSPVPMTKRPFRWRNKNKHIQDHDLS